MNNYSKTFEIGRGNNGYYFRRLSDKKNIYNLNGDNVYFKTVDYSNSYKENDIVWYPLYKEYTIENDWSYTNKIVKK